MCKASKPRIQQEAPPEKPRAPFTTPDQLNGRGLTANLNAARAGRNSLRIDRGSDPTMAGTTPVENDTVRDFPAEAAKRKADAQLAGGLLAQKKREGEEARMETGHKIFDPAHGSRTVLKKLFKF